MSLLAPRAAACTRPLSRRKLLSSIAAPSVKQQHRFISAYGYEQAKALIYSEYGEPKDVLRLHQHSLPPAHSHLTTLRLLASPLNPADINTLQGSYPTKAPFTTSLSTPQPSAVPGNEGVAEVISAGSSCVDSQGEKLEKGDWVIFKSPGTGTWRTHLQCSGEGLVKLSAEMREGVSPVQAGTVSVNPCTAWAMLKGFVGTGAGGGKEGRAVQKGEWFIQNGANSGVGRAAIQLAREWGVRSLNVVRARPGGEQETEKLKGELRGLGADVVVTEEEAGEKGWSGFVKEVTGDADVVLGLNCVGGRSALNLSKVLGEGGWLVTYGAMAKQPLSVPAGMLIFRDLRFAGFWVSRWSEACPEEKLEAVREVLRLTREGRFGDTPFAETRWDYGTGEETLKGAVQGTLEGFRGGKGVFVFGDI